jgi:hypothetical protein
MDCNIVLLLLARFLDPIHVAELFDCPCSPPSPLYGRWEFCVVDLYRLHRALGYTGGLQRRWRDNGTAYRSTSTSPKE